MNTEAIIEKLLQIQNEQILNTPLDDLDLSPRVYRSLCRSRVRTVREAAEIWNRNLKVWNIGERARREILGALQAWCLSLPNFTEPDAAEDQAEVPDGDLDLRSPIEALHLSQRTYRALKRNQIDTLDDIYREWDKIASTRGVGTKTLDEIQKALDAPLLSEKRPLGGIGSFANPDGTGLKTRLTNHLTGETARLAVDGKDPNRESHLAKNDFADRSAADAIGYEMMSERLTKKYVITDSGVVVSVDLLQAEEPRKPREERWKNVSREQVSAQPQDYSPKNIFQAIGQGQNKISSPFRRQKKALDGSVPVSTEWLEMSLYLLEKARTSRQVRTINCPICMAITLSIRFRKHLVNEHPQAFRELKKAVRRR